MRILCMQLTLSRDDVYGYISTLADSNCPNEVPAGQWEYFDGTNWVCLPVSMSLLTMYQISNVLVFTSIKRKYLCF